MNVQKAILLALHVPILSQTVSQHQGWGRESEYKSSVRHGEFSYFSSLRTDYKMRIMQNSVYAQIDMRIDPCKNEIQTGGYGKACCMKMNQVACQNHPYSVRGGEDLQIAYFQNAHVPSCNQTPFENDPNCGTYIEIHNAVGPYSEESLNLVDPEYRGPGREVEFMRDFDPGVLADVKIEEEYPDGFQTLYIGTHRLCSGWYELWWVLRTVHAGPYVLRRIPFFVYFPSCPVPELLEEEIAKLAAERAR